LGRRARLAVLPGDGIGPEVTAAAVTVLKAVAVRFGHDFIMSEWPIGASAMRTKGVPLPEETLEACRGADAVLLGAVGDPAYDLAPRDKRPEAGLLGIPDPELLERSFASGRVLVTQDGDFVGLHRDLHPLTPRAPSCLTHAHTPQPYAASCSRRATT